MTRREDAAKPDTEQANGAWTPKVALPAQKKPLIATWLSQFEEKIARDFQRRTGMDYKNTIALIIEAADPFPGMQVLDVPTGTGVIARSSSERSAKRGRSPAPTHRAKSWNRLGWRRTRRKSPCASNGGK